MSAIDWKGLAFEHVAPGAIMSTNEIERAVVESGQVGTYRSGAMLFWKDYEKLRRALNSLAADGALTKGKQGTRCTWARVEANPS